MFRLDREHLVSVLYASPWSVQCVVTTVAQSIRHTYHVLERSVVITYLGLQIVLEGVRQWTRGRLEHSWAHSSSNAMSVTASPVKADIESRPSGNWKLLTLRVCVCVRACVRVCVHARAPASEPEFVN